MINVALFACLLVILLSVMMIHTEAKVPSAEGTYILKDIQTRKQARPLIRKIVRAMEKTFHYVDKASKKVPIDTIYGMVLAQKFLKKLKKNRMKRLPKDIQKSIKKFNGKPLKQYLDRALAYQKKLHPKQFRRFASLRYMPIFKDNALPYAKPFKKGHSVKYTELVADRCLVQSMKCVRSSHCVKNVFPPTYLKGYSITHTLLYYYYMMGSCQKKKNQLANYEFAYRSLSRLMPTILGELDNTTPLTDETIETYLIPMVLGDSRHTATKEFLDALLIIFQSQGCFKDDNPSIRQVVNPKDSLLYGVKTLLDYPSGDDCSYHTTGIGFALLSNYLRLLVNARF